MKSLLGFSSYLYNFTIMVEFFFLNHPFIRLCEYFSARGYQISYRRGCVQLYLVKDNSYSSDSTFPRSNLMETNMYRRWKNQARKWVILRGGAQVYFVFVIGRMR